LKEKEKDQQRLLKLQQMIRDVKTKLTVKENELTERESFIETKIEHQKGKSFQTCRIVKIERKTNDLARVEPLKRIQSLELAKIN
jgi:hypothetical protein